MKSLFQTIAALYGLELHSSEKVTKGFLSENHILFSDTEKYFLKKYRFDKEDRIIEVHAAKQYFSENGIPVILPFPTKENKTYFFFENGYFALFPFIDGRQPERNGLTDQEIVSLGSMLGKIHLVGRDATIVNNDSFKLPTVGQTLQKILDISIAIKTKGVTSQFDKDALVSIKLKTELLQANVVNQEKALLPNDHLIHGDYLDHNVFFDESGEVSYVFDLEKTSYSPRSFELFRSMVYGFLDVKNLELSFNKMKLYFDSYVAIYPMQKEEIEKGLNLFRLKSLHDVWVESEHYLKDNSRVDEFLYSCYDRVVFLEEHFDELLKKILS